MADWDYIVGETGFVQPFVLYDRRTRLPIDGAGIASATITIVKPDGTDATPQCLNEAMSINTTNPLKLDYTVSSSTNVPQVVGSYLGIITMTFSGSITRKTYEIDLRVYRG